MDDQQKTRLILIGAAGVLLLGGGGWWVMTQNNAADKAEQASNEAPVSTKPKAPAGQTNGASTAPNPNTVASTPPAGTTPAPGTTAATPPTSPTPPIPAKGLGLAGAMDPDAATATAPAPTPPVAPGTTIASSTIPGTPFPNPLAAGGEPIKAAPAGKYPSTKRDEAVSIAKQVAGRQDPMQGTFEKVPYPAPWTKAGSGGSRTSNDDESDEKKDRDKAEGKSEKVLPPPPPPVAEKPVPPPPPSSVAEAPSLPIDNLPQPPDKPLVSPSLKLSAILGNKAVLSVPMQLRTQNKWPSVICLGPGEKFEDPANGSFSVVSVDQDSVTIDEEGERSVKSLPQIK